MKRQLLSLGLVAIAAAACGSSNSTAPPVITDEIVGTWTSTGADVAPGLIATFSSNNSYTVAATDSSNAVVTFTGVWLSNGGAGTIRGITLNQATPSALTSQGIFQVVGTRLTYEVIQVAPAIAGFTPPSVAGGFGSTSYNGVHLGATWTQKFSKQ